MSLNLTRIKLSVIVHIIEVRDLASKDNNNLSDPFIKIVVNGQKQQTEIKHATVSATYDKIFTFHNIELSQDAYERENIYIECIDANTFFRNELIGRHTFSLKSIRNQTSPQHQIYKKWIVLLNPKFPNEGQGYLQTTITVLGPGDIPPSHVHETEIITSPPTLTNQPTFGEKRNIIGEPIIEKRRGYNFSIKIFRGENLPGFDLAGLMDPFVVVKFNGQVNKTPVKWKTLQPDWNFQLVLPVFTPTLSDIVEIQLWDYIWGNIFK